MAQQEDLEKTYREYYPLLFAIAYRMLGSASDAEDIVQESYLRYAQAAPKEIHSTKAYLTTIVTHLCLDYLKADSFASYSCRNTCTVHLPRMVRTGLASTGRAIH